MSNSSTVNTSQLLFSSEQQQILSSFLGAIIPASEEYAVPAANDSIILADLLSSASSTHTSIKEVLSALEQCAQQDHQMQYTTLTGEQQLLIAKKLQASNPETIWPLITLAFECYYRDDRVMSSINMEIRPPFPQGFTVEQGDWSLLDQVKKRPKFYREI